MEKDKTWAEYIHDSQRKEDFKLKNNDEGAPPPILKDEVEYAMKTMKHGKAPRPDKITIEMLNTLQECLYAAKGLTIFRSVMITCTRSVYEEMCKCL